MTVLIVGMATIFRAWINKGELLVKTGNCRNLGRPFVTSQRVASDEGRKGLVPMPSGPLSKFEVYPSD